MFQNLKAQWNWKSPIWLKFGTKFVFHVQVAVQISGNTMTNTQVLFHADKHAPYNNG